MAKSLESRREGEPTDAGANNEDAIRLHCSVAE
jgi:hypothetical protein